MNKEVKMFKFELDQTVYYIKDNRLHSAPIMSRMVVENLKPTWNSTKEQVDFYQRFGPCRVVYATVHGTYDESSLFESPEALAAFIIKGYN